LRPSAAFVAQSLFMILVQHPQVAELEQQATGELKRRVKSALDLAQKKIKDKSGENEGSPTVSREDEEVLRSLAYHGDPVGAALLGSSIWRGLIEVEDDEGPFVSLQTEDLALGKSQSNRSVLP